MRHSSVTSSAKSWSPSPKLGMIRSLTSSAASILLINLSFNSLCFFLNSLRKSFICAPTSSELEEDELLLPLPEEDDSGLAANLSVLAFFSFDYVRSVWRFCCLDLSDTDNATELDYLDLALTLADLADTGAFFFFFGLLSSEESMLPTLILLASCSGMAPMVFLSIVDLFLSSFFSPFRAFLCFFSFKSCR